MLNWISRINIGIAFIVLFVFHMLFYRLWGTDNWLTVALLASIVETGVLAAVQLILGGRRDKVR